MFDEEQKRKQEAAMLRHEQRVEDFQRRNFEERYVRSTLSGLEIPIWVGQKISNYMKNQKNMLVYHGSPGIGKTKFCAALVDWMMSNFNTVRYHKEGKLLGTLRSMINEGHGDWEINLKLLIDDDIVILDDVGSGINPEKITYRDLEHRRDVFYEFLDFRYNLMKPTIITSNFSKNDFHEVYSDRICSRLFAKENTIISVFGEEAIDKRTLGM